MRPVGAPHGRGCRPGWGGSTLALAAWRAHRWCVARPPKAMVWPSSSRPGSAHAASPRLALRCRSTICLRSGRVSGNPRGRCGGWLRSALPATPVPLRVGTQGGGTAPSLPRVRVRPGIVYVIDAGPWWWTKLSPPSARIVAATAYSCSAMRGAVGAWVAMAWPGRASRWGTAGSKCAGHFAIGPKVTGATADVKTVRSVVRYCMSPVVSVVRCRQAVVHAATPQLVRFGSVASTVWCPRCCTVPSVPSGGPCNNPSRPCPAGGVGGGRCGNAIIPRRCGCVAYGSCWRCSGPTSGGTRVGVGTSGRARWMGCGGSASAPPCLHRGRPPLGAAVPTGRVGLTCPPAGCGLAGRTPGGVPVPSPRPRP